MGPMPWYTRLRFWLRYQVCLAIGHSKETVYYDGITYCRRCGEDTWKP